MKHSFSLRFPSLRFPSLRPLPANVDLPMLRRDVEKLAAEGHELLPKDMAFELLEKAEGKGKDKKQATQLLLQLVAGLKPTVRSKKQIPAGRR